MKSRLLENYPGYVFYEDGRIWSEPKGKSNPKGKFLKHTSQHHGYTVVSIVERGEKKQRSLHKLMATAFIPNPKKLPQINHINGNKKDNRLSNLEWCSAKQNTQHAERIGLRRHLDGGENNTRAKLTNTQAREIKRLVSEGISQMEISRTFGVCQSVVSFIKLGKSYKNA